MQETINNLIAFTHSIGFTYLIIGCWLINVLMVKTENKKLRKRCETLQAENVKFQKCHKNSSSFSDDAEG